MNAYFIEASTGCTCCSNENFITGPFLSLEQAKEKAEEFRQCKRLASQYASHGIYYLYEFQDAEQLPDGRIICGHRIFDAPPSEDEDYGSRDEFQDDSFLWQDKMELLKDITIGGQTHNPWA